ncbi:hypothetical protein BCU84_05635 [Shewanella sp. 10N.286.51.B7]|uniref:hypothetical protein n=1 Tax=Shewanella sp. 10N.286.51.B7 TaxID=1880836 RepID=UPI000C81BB3D|nr:hypothetical protein [Shewanella sp. 10N.286.51.B7]PMG79374.1 hypothetical protein BCU84_05635 [Shewanella sp. 10N.286.51.B7]
MRIKKISALVAIALSTSLVAGCDFYDEPPGDGGTDPGQPPVETPDVADVVASSSAELLSAIDTAEAGTVIGLNIDGSFENVGTIVINKAITLITSDADGAIDDPVENEQAILSGAVCIDIPTEAAEILRGGEQARISNLAFENIVMDSCGLGESTSNSIINIGKVGKDKTAVILDNLSFDGTGFEESTSDSAAWVYSRGLVNISDSVFTNKSTDAQSMIYLNCGSSASRGGSYANDLGSIMAGNIFALAEINANDATKAATIGVPSNLGQENKNCAATFTGNTFEKFGFLISETSDQSTALYDVFGDTTESDNTLTDGDTDPGVPPEVPDVVTTVAELHAAIDAASSGTVISLDVAGDFADAGTLIINQAITLQSTDSEGVVTETEQAIFSGAVCIDIPTEAAEILRNGNQAKISNIGFENIVMNDCGSGESTSTSIINIGKVGKDKTAVALENLTFDGSGFEESTGESDAWVYSRGLVDISDSEFVNKSADAQNIVYLNCGSSASRGGSNSDPRGSIISGSTFGLGADNTSGMTIAATIGVPSNLGQEDKNCGAEFTDNTFDKFNALISENNDIGTALYDVFGDTTETNNTVTGGGTDPEPTYPENVDEVNAAIQAATAGSTITLGASFEYSTGVITIDRAITLTGQTGAAISGSACIDVVDGAAGAQITNITFNNDAIAKCGATDDAKEAVINIQKVGEDGMPIILDNLSFDASNITEQDQIENKGAWIRSYGFINLTGSEFLSQSRNLQNDMVKLTCSSSKGRMGTLVDGNSFSIIGDGNKETAAVKIGDSSGGVIKDADNENTCAVTVSNNTFTDYTLEAVNDVGEGVRDAAIFARLPAESTNVFTGNTHN